MPEIKKQFTGGKMNKDVDERLVPTGEYRNAMNIQVSTSEGSDVGTVQNILGNSLVLGQDDLPNNISCVGSISDEKNDALYWLLTNAKTAGVALVNFNASSTQPEVGGSWILRKKDYIEPVFVDVAYVMYSMYNASGNIGYDLTNNQITLPPGPNTIVVGMILNVYSITLGGILQGEQVVTNVSGNVITLDQPPTNLDALNTGGKQWLLNTTLVFSNTQGNNSVLGLEEGNLITGINIIDNLLFWTDNKTEPKKINIDRSIAGTPDFFTHTSLIVNGANLGPIKESHITVIKKAPSKPPKLVELTSIRQGSISGQTAAINFADSSGILMPEGNVIWIAINHNNSGDPPSYELGDIIRLNDQASLLYPPENYKVRGLIDEIQSGPFSASGVSVASSTQHAYKITVLTLSSETLVMPAVYEVALEQEGFNLFERKFPRFAYRYKYEDGEYSSIGPFSEVAFVPGNFRYHPTEAFNKAMINNLKELTLKDFIPLDMPKDVVQVDLLYRNDTAPSIYLLKSVLSTDVAWNAVGSMAGLSGSYLVTTENIVAQLPSNQSLRIWDNVPRTALAQEVTGSRVVYGNYTQGYDIIDSNGALISPLVKSYLNVREGATTGTKTQKSIKSLRTYNFGVVYGDVYGRETPVLTHSDATQIVPKSQSPNSNSISISVENNHPAWADYYKVYVKETSNEYYNLAVDRLYDAQDGNVWVSFPSVDRNKVDEDTYIILKKGIDVQAAVMEPARYKIVAIENEAPDYIKTTYTLLGEPNMQIDGFALLGGSTTGATAQLVSPAEAPYPGHTSFSVDVKHWSDPYDPIALEMGLTDLEELWEDNNSNEIYVSFSNNATVNANVVKLQSTRYLVTSIVKDTTGVAPVFVVHINKPIPDSESWITDNLHETWLGNGQLRTHFFKKEIINKPEFDGRFFVKILEDSTVRSKLTSSLEVDDDWKVVASTDMYYLSDSGAPDPTITSDGLMTYPDTTGYIASGWNNGVTDTQGVVTGLNIEEWNNNLKFGGTTPRGGWFIDKAAYAGTQPLTSNNITNALAAGACVISGNIFSEIDRPLDNTNYTFSSPGTGLSNGLKFNKGLWTELEPNPSSDDIASGYLSGSLVVKMDNPVAGTMEIGDLITGGSIPPGALITVVAIEVNGNLDEFEASQGVVASATNTLTFTGRTNHLTLSYSMIEPNATGATSLTGEWGVGVPQNPFTEDQEDIVNQLQLGKKFRIRGSDVVYTIDDVSSIRNYNYRGKVTFPPYKVINVLGPLVTSTYAVDNYYTQLEEMGNATNRRLTYNIKYSPDESGINLIDNPEVQTVTGTEAVGLEFIEEYSADQPNTISDKPAVFETEPKEDTDLDIYYEASGKIATNTVGDNISNHIPIGSVVTFPGGEPVPAGTTVVSWDGEYFTLSNEIELSSLQSYISANSQEGIRFVNSDGSYVSARYNGGPITGITYLPSNPTQAVQVTDKITLVSTSKIGLAWFNCWSFNNGVESNRIGDTYNKPFITNGVKVSTTLDDEQKQEHRKYGLIYSGLYNSTSGVNSLNQFIAAEKITKDLNPTYGSIQKLHTRDSDLIALCEDKILKIVANKDALFNADGNPQLVATDRVLGQAIPFVGEYGISKNPESFASESYRAYFTDKSRGAVIRLSMDGITPISEAGMSDWFKDNLKLNDTIIGSYDDNKNEYNVTLAYFVETAGGYDPGLRYEPVRAIKNARLSNARSSNAQSDPISGGPLPGGPGQTSVNPTTGGPTPVGPGQISGNQTSVNPTTGGPITGGPEPGGPDRPIGIFSVALPTTVSFKESVKGWVSFKSFIPENAISCNNEYYTFLNGKLYLHHDKNEDRNTFYRDSGLGELAFTPSRLSVVLNDVPGSVKSFNTLNYEGSQSKVIQDIGDDQYFNLDAKDGWFVDHAFTNKEEGSLNEFIEKEGKWFNYIKGVSSYVNYSSDLAGFNVQGIGVWGSGCEDGGEPTNDCEGATIYETNDELLEVAFSPGNHNIKYQFIGVIGDTQNTCDAVRLINPFYHFQQAPSGHTGGTSAAQTLDHFINDHGAIGLTATSTYAEFMAVFSQNPHGHGGSTYGPCRCTFSTVCGCTDPLSPLFNPLANSSDGSCGIPGCMHDRSENYNPLATFDDGSCIIDGPGVVPGCTDLTAQNYDGNATVDDGSCIASVYGCTDPLATNYYAGANIDDGSCTYGPLPIPGCTNPLATNYNPLANIDDGSCVLPAGGCSPLPCPSTTYTKVPNPTFENNMEVRDTGGYSVPLGDPNAIGDGTNSNGLIRTAQACITTQVNLRNKGINDLTGIEDFISLMYLRVDGNNLTSLDLSNNHNLVSLWTYNNSIEHLYLGSCLDLTQLAGATLLDSSNISAFHMVGAAQVHVGTPARVAQANAIFNIGYSTSLCGQGSVAGCNSFSPGTVFVI